MRIFFIGAGPGDPDLLTLKAHKILSKTKMCLYAGSLVPREILSIVPKEAKLIDTSDLTMKQIEQLYIRANNPSSETQYRFPNSPWYPCLCRRSSAVEN